MELLHPHCAGLDVHKDTVVACIRHMVDSKVTVRLRPTAWLTGPGCAKVGYFVSFAA
jgi:hypothetical protein